MDRASTVRALALRLHAAGDAAFVEDPPGSGVFAWRTRLGRWPFEMQVDRYALEIRCYLADDLFCTGRIREDETDYLVAPSSGPGDPDARRELADLVDGATREDPHRFLAPPHADRHPDRRDDPRQQAVIAHRPKRDIDMPA
jgi:hypothetical protein